MATGRVGIATGAAGAFAAGAVPIEIGRGTGFGASACGAIVIGVPKRGEG